MITAQYTSKSCYTSGTGTVRILRRHTYSLAALLSYNILINDIHHGKLTDGQVMEIEVSAGPFKLQVKEGSYAYTRSKQLGKKTIHVRVTQITFTVSHQTKTNFIISSVQ
jgi:hypothetical protein